MEDRIEHIQELQEKDFKYEKRQSMVLNNFYSIVTIIIVCLSIIFYTVYIVPAQEAKKAREDKILKQEQYQQLREKQIALSHRLNNPKKEIKIDATK